MNKFIFVSAALVVIIAATTLAAAAAVDRNANHPVRAALHNYVKLRNTAKLSSSHKLVGLGQCPINTSSCFGPASAGGTVCCQGGESPQAETCCPDKIHGGVCCVEELTMCCAPQTQYDHPSRCCPRWSVCCEYGKYGCCDPDTMKPVEELSLAKQNDKRRLTGGANVVAATALLLEPNWLTAAQTLFAAKVDLSTGDYTQKKVQSDTGRFDPVGETPRSFMFDRATNQFYLLQANFTAPPAGSKNPDRQIMLYTINGATGAVTMQVVAGAVDEVTGYYYVEAKKTIVFSTLMYSDEKKESAIGFNFYTLDPTAPSAKLISKSIRGPRTGNWDGWFHAVDDDIKYVYRLGYQHVRTSQNFGLEVTDISAPVATVAFLDDVRVPDGHNIYKTLTIMPSGSPNAALIKQRHGFAADDNPVFISLAANATTMSLDAFMWSAATPAKVPKHIASYSNAHSQVYFGPIQEAVSKNGGLFAAIVVGDSPWGSNSDTVNMVSTNLLSGASQEVVLSPKLLAETVSYAGLGIAEEH